MRDTLFQHIPSGAGLMTHDLKMYMQGEGDGEEDVPLERYRRGGGRQSGEEPVINRMKSPANKAE